MSCLQALVLVSLRFTKLNGGVAREPDLGTIVSLPPFTYHEVYYSHPNPDVDVAAINLSTVIETHPEIYWRQLTLDFFADLDTAVLLPGMDVMFVGYPLGLYDEVNNLPIMRCGRIASHPLVDFNGRPEFLVDAQVFPGSSGSPVFASVDGKARLLGMIGRSISRKVPIEFIETTAVPVVPDLIGLGVVYKPKALLEVIEAMAASLGERYNPADA
jgi:hypothetical protein